MGKEIKELYYKAGIQAPEGKGEHTQAFHRRAIDIMQGYKKDGLTEDEKRIAYATSMKQLGADRSVNPLHRRKALEKQIGG